MAQKEQETAYMAQERLQTHQTLIQKEKEAIQAKEMQADDLYRKAVDSGDAELMSKADTLKSDLSIQKEKVRMAEAQSQQTFQNQMAAQQAGAGLQLAGGELFGQFGVQAPQSQANLATTLSQLGVTETQAQQQAANQTFQNQMAQYTQPYQQLSFQSGLLGGVSPAYLQNPATTAGNPLLAGIGALGGYAR